MKLRKGAKGGCHSAGSCRSPVLIWLQEMHNLISGEVCRSATSSYSSYLQGQTHWTGLRENWWFDTPFFKSFNIPLIGFCIHKMPPIRWGDWPSIPSHCLPLSRPEGAASLSVLLTITRWLLCPHATPPAASNLTGLVEQDERTHTVHCCATKNTTILWNICKNTAHKIVPCVNLST